MIKPKLEQELLPRLELEVLPIPEPRTAIFHTHEILKSPSSILESVKQELLAQKEFNDKLLKVYETRSAQYNFKINDVNSAILVLNESKTKTA